MDENDTDHAELRAHILEPLLTASNLLWAAYGDTRDTSGNDRLTQAGMALGIAGRLLSGELNPSKDHFHALLAILDQAADRRPAEAEPTPKPEAAPGDELPPGPSVSSA